jgi:hypothetical protein
MSLTPEIDLDANGTPHCPVCFAEIDTWAIEKRAIEHERERIIALLESIRVGDDWVGRDYAITLIKGNGN